jgi:hypothetical protein
MKKLCSILLIAVMLLTCAPVAFADDGTLSIEYEGARLEDGILYITLEMDNDTGSKASFGWVNSCEILVTIDGRTTSIDPNPFDDIPRGNSTYIFEMEAESDEIERIEITNLRSLSDRGLPDKELKDVVVYDIDEGIDEFEGSFKTPLIQILPFIFMGIGILLFILFLIVLLVLYKKTQQNNQRAAKQFQPYAPDQPKNTDDSVNPTVDGVTLNGFQAPPEE